MRFIVLVAVAFSVLTVGAPQLRVAQGAVSRGHRHQKVAHVKIVTEADTVGAYRPKTVVVHLGQRIVFRNVSNAIHTVTADRGKAFDSGNIAAGKSWMFTAKHVGAFPYHCIYHSFMHGKIVVKH